MARLLYLDGRVAVCEPEDHDERRSDLDILRGLVDLATDGDEGTLRAFLETFAASLPHLHAHGCFTPPGGGEARAGELKRLGVETVNAPGGSPGGSLVHYALMGHYEKGGTSRYLVPVWQVFDIAAGVMLVCRLSLYSRGMFELPAFSNEPGTTIGLVTLALPHCLQAAETVGAWVKATEKDGPPSLRGTFVGIDESLPAAHRVEFVGGISDADLNAQERAELDGDEDEARRIESRIWSRAPRTLAAAALASIANGTASRPYTIDARTGLMVKSSESRLFDSLFDLAATGRVICCAHCGKPLFITRKNATHFCSVSHQNRYNDKAQAMLYAGASVDEVAAAFPYIKRATINGWQ